MTPVTDPALLAQLNGGGTDAPTGPQPVTDPELLAQLNAPEKDLSYSSKLLPFSRDAKGEVSFDSDAGLLGSVKRALTLGNDVATGQVPLRNEDGDLSDDLIKRSLEAVSVATPRTAGTIMRPRPVASAPVGPAANPVIEASERIGVQVPRAASTDNMTIQRAGQTLANIPGVGNSLKKASENAITQIGDAAERTATGYSRAGTPSAQQAGGVLKEGIENYIGPVTSARSQKAYDAVDGLVNEKATAPLAATAAKVAEIAAQREAAGLPPSAASKIVEGAITRDGGLNYQGTKLLRQRVGEMLNSGPLPADISGSELKQVYSSLTNDLKNIVQTSGGEKGLAAFERANKYHRLVSERRENLSRLLKTTSEEGALEKILASASSSSRSDVALLTQARKALPRDEWGDIASTAVGRLGKGGKDNTFSADRFVTDYSKLSKEGKAVLFGSTGNQAHARALDDIATVAGRFKELQKFANPSGTGQTLLGGGAIAAVVSEPVTAITTLLGAAAASKVLSTPATARSMAQWSRAYEAAVTRPATATKQAYEHASRRLAITMGADLGLSTYVQQIMRALQGAIPAGADENQNGGVRVGQ